MVDNGTALMNKIVLPVPLAKNLTIDRNSNISIYLYKESRRLLSDRLLASVIMLSVLDLIIDPSYQAIFIKSTVPDITDISGYTLKVDFASGLLVSEDGLPFDSTTNTFPMSDPTFLSSYYSVK